MSEPEQFEDLRPLMFSIAYRMLSSVSEAEDVVQNAFLRYRRAIRDGIEIGSLKAYLSAIVTRLCIDALRSARARREVYVGFWLPEPLETSQSSDRGAPEIDTERADSLSMAFLLVLERLNPVERAVFLLHDVFGYDYEVIAEMVDKSQVNCRQIAARARRHVRSNRPRFEASRASRDALADRFFSAVTEGNVDDLIELLAHDVVVYGDGGGKVPQWMQAIVGADRVSRLFGGLGRKMQERGIRLIPTEINGQPGAICQTTEGRITNVFALDIMDGVVTTVRSVINPDKLQHLGEVADVWALLRSASGTQDSRAASKETPRCLGERK